MYNICWVAIDGSPLFGEVGHMLMFVCERLIFNSLQIIFVVILMLAFHKEYFAQSIPNFIGILQIASQLLFRSNFSLNLQNLTNGYIPERVLEYFAQNLFCFGNLNSTFHSIHYTCYQFRRIFQFLMMNIF